MDISSINKQILPNFKEERAKLGDYKDRLDQINSYLESPNLRYRVASSLKKAKEELLLYIKDLEVNESRNYYIAESAELIRDYQKILKTKIRVSFMGKKKQDNGDKRRIINEYLSIAKKYVDIDLPKEESEQVVTCNNCPNTKNFDIIDGNVYICHECCSEQVIIKHTSPWNDIDRVNISPKYMYDRKVHFRDCIFQLQAKQNSSVPHKVYEQLEDQFEKNYLLDGDKNSPKEIRFARITKSLVRMFLGELGFNKHYENVHLIHYNFTGMKPDDISHLEDQLLDDFDALTEVYDDLFKHLSRKSFISTQYVLYQLLRRHKHPCNIEDFNILKTWDRKAFHDEVCSVCFQALGWNLNCLAS